MPPLQPVPGVVRLVHKGMVGAARPWANIFHVGLFTTSSGVRTTDSWLQAEIDTLVAAARAAWITNWRPVIGAFVTLDSTFAVDLTDESGVVATDNVSSAGSLSGSAPPASCAQCISWQENLHYRGGHLRTYLPPPTSSQLNNAFTWTTAHQGNLEAAASAYRLAIKAIVPSTGLNADLVGVHRIRAAATLNDPIVTLVTGQLVDARVDSQRRRLGPDL